MAHWEHYEHGADIGVRGIGADQTEAFIQAAIALTAVITDPRHVEKRSMLEIDCEAPDAELLLVDWLNALIYAMASRHMLFSEFELDITTGGLHARVWGEPIDRKKHRPVVEIKGATYTTLKVARKENGEWVAQTVVDV